MLVRRLRPPRSLRLAMSHSRNGSLTPRKKDKGKKKAEVPNRPTSPYNGPGTNPEPISSLLEEALNTPLSPPSISSSLDSSFERPSLISPPPKAHQPDALRPHHPRLLSSLARSTLPTAGLSYATDEGLPRGRKTHDAPRLGESSTSWKHPSSTSLYDGPFPDLDPATGLPLERTPDSLDPTARSRSLYLQRTITGILATPSQPAEEHGIVPYLSNLTSALPHVSLPGSRLSSESLRTGSRRNLSTSAPQEDWTSWATGWWGNKKKVDRTLSEEDQADTVEEEREKHRRKCRQTKWIQTDNRSDAKTPPCLLSWASRIRCLR